MIMDEIKKRRASSHYEEILHPNEEVAEKNDEEIDPNAPFHWPTSRFVVWFLKFDEETLRPFFIRKYSKTRLLIEDQYQELIRK